MPGADVAGREPRGVVWRVRDALLAAPLAAVVEITAVDGDGQAAARAGPLPARVPPGIGTPEAATRAVVVQTAHGPVAMAADEVEGVREWSAADVAELPAWLGSVPRSHLVALVRLDDHRLAALLDPDRLPGA